MKQTFFRNQIILSVIFITFILAWPFISFIVTPYYEKIKTRKFIEIAEFSSLSEREPHKLYFQMIETDVFLTHTVTEQVWVIKYSPTKVKVFSPICTHLGCRYNWQKKTRKFFCPCHASIFSIDGKVEAGPAPRPLDTLPHKVKAGKLYIKWERYKAGISKKVAI